MDGLRSQLVTGGCKTQNNRKCAGTVVIYDLSKQECTNQHDKL